MTVLLGLLLNNSSWYLYRSWYWTLVASSAFCMTIVFALFSFEMLTIANISSWIVVLILSKLHVGLAFMNFSYFSTILLAVTNLLSLLEGHVCKLFRLATCQLSVLELVDNKHLQVHVAQSHRANILCDSFLLNLITLLSSKLCLITAFLNYFFPVNFMPITNLGLGTFLLNLG